LRPREREIRGREMREAKSQLAGKVILFLGIFWG